MYLFLILLWCAAVTEACSGPNIVGDNSRNSRFGEFNSRLGQRKFPIRSATGIGSQDNDLARSFRDRTVLFGGKSMNFPFEREKPRIDRPHRGVRAAMLSGTAR
jgi:hypothetical protein